MDVSIVSGDRDLLQLATERVQIRIPKTKKTGTEIENYYANFDLRRTAKADSATITVYDPSQPLNARIRQGTYADLYAYSDLKDAEGDNLPEVTKIFIHTYGAYRRPVDIFVLK